MASNLLQYLIENSFLITGLLFLVLILRVPVRAWFGCAIAYQVWAFIPLVLIVSALPAAPKMAQIPVAAQPVVAWAAQTTPLVYAQESTGAYVILGLWLLGVVTAITYFCMQHKRYIKTLGRLTQVEDIYFAEHLTASPVLVGVWRTKILVPADFLQRYSLQERQLILAHERNHAHRGDPTFNLICAALQCLFWFHPLLHFAVHYFRMDQELACDASVIAAFPKSQQLYAAAMLKTQTSGFQTPIACQLNSYQSLKERVMQLNKIMPSKRKTLVGKIFIVLFSGLCAYGAWALSLDTIENAVMSPAGSSASDANKTYTLVTKLQIGNLLVAPPEPQSFINITAKGEQHISLNVESVKWDVKYEYNPVQTPDGKPALLIVTTIKRNGEVIAKPGVMTEFDKEAIIEQKNPANPNANFRLSLMPMLQKNK